MATEISNAEDWYVHELVAAWLKANPDETSASLARLVGVSKMTMSKVAKGTRAGLNVAMKTGKAIAQLEWPEFQKRAASEYKKRGPIDTHVEYNERYPNRAAVLETLKPDLHPETVKRISGGMFDSESDLTRTEWFTQINAFDLRVRRELQNPARAAKEKASKRKAVEDALRDEDK